MKYSTRSLGVREVKPSFVAVLLIAAMSAAISGCGKGDASDGTGSEVAIAAVGGGASASEGSVALNDASPRTGQTSSLLAQMKGALSFLPSAWAVPACSWSGLISACSSNSETLTFGGCSLPLDSAISISGSESLVWSGSGCCTSAPLTASSLTPCSFVRRTINSSGVADPLTRSIGTNSVTLNTEDSSGYETPKSGGFTVLCQGAGGVNTCAGQREVTIAGAHYVAEGGRMKWDHTVSTDAPVVVQGSGASRRVLSGTLRVQHNLAKTTSITTITSTLTHTAGCCFPTGGSVSTTFSGGKLDGKTETMTFGPSCAQATLSDTSEKQTGITLHHCL